MNGWRKENSIDFSGIYFSPIRTAVTVFGSVFSNIVIKKKKGKGFVDYKVPVSFASQSNYAFWLADADSRTPEESRDNIEIRKVLPAMSFDFTDFAMDTARQTNPLIKNLVRKPDSGLNVYNGAFYTIGFTLSIYAKELMSSLLVLDKILPDFKPELAVKVLQQKEMKIIEDCKIILKSVSRADNALEGLTSNRLITWTLDFSLNAIFFAKEKENALITEVKLDIEI
jgi:hypothetical protein